MFALIWYHIALELLADVYIGLPVGQRECLAAEVEALTAIESHFYPNWRSHFTFPSRKESSA